MKTATGTLVIKPGRLIDGTGRGPIDDAAVVVQEGRIAYAGPITGAPPTPPDTQVIDARGGTIMPGLVEAHYHPTYFNVADLADLDIKYPVEFVTLLAANNAAPGARMRLHGGPQRRQPPQHRRLAQTGDRRGAVPRSASGRQRSRDLRFRRTDGLEPRLSATRHARADTARQRPDRSTCGRAQADQGRRRVGQDLPHRRCRQRPRRSSQLVHDTGRDAGGRRRGAQLQGESHRSLSGEPGHQERASSRIRYARTRLIHGRRGARPVDGQTNAGRPGAAVRIRQRPARTRIQHAAKGNRRPSRDARRRRRERANDSRRGRNRRDWAATTALPGIRTARMPRKSASS